MIKYRINWILDKPTDDGTSLRMRVKWNSSKNIVTFTLPYRVDVDKWSPDAQRCMARSFHTTKKISATIINRNIDGYEGIVSSIFSTNENLTNEQFKDLFLIALGKKEEKSDIQTFFDIYDEFVRTESLRNNWTSRTISRFGTIKNILKGYNNSFSIEDIDAKFMQGLQHYFSVVKRHKNSYTKMMLNTFLWFLRWAKKQGYYNGNALEMFSTKLKGTENTKAIFYLTWEELQQIINTPMPQPYLERVRDVFVFCCFTSLRYSDVANLKKSDIHKDYFIINIIKTGAEVKIELNDYSRAVLEKYKDAILPNNKALPTIHISKFNQFLRKVAHIAGINSNYKRVYYIGSERHEVSGEKWEFITSHCARRTFVVNALYLGIPAEVIMRWTGHSDYDAMKPYIDIVDELKQEQMNKFNKH